MVHELPELGDVAELNVQRVDEQDDVNGHVPDDLEKELGVGSGFRFGFGFGFGLGFGFRFYVADHQRHQEGYALCARRQAEEVRVEHRAPRLVRVRVRVRVRVN